ncbi:LysE family translocator [Siculibacillus lacustris]|uniref:LysE family translocator n=1 Tax=Siculibacillus lacustris TaxID=1549641 RepID=A0A4Q9VKB5_9HYPH|nr:LysE family translocator [Siculibacillus lacustris]TBW35834.1 LysE family translocator [Siculibacillus lacustris]
MIAALPAASIVAAYAVAVILLVLTPGPDMALFLGRTLSTGRGAGLAALAGTTAGLYVHTALAAIGLSALLAASPLAFTVLKIAGAGWLVVLAIQTLRHGALFETRDEARAPESLARAFLAGLGVNIFNPKIVLFFVTFLPQFVDPGDAHAARTLAILGGLYGVIGAPICVGLIFAADRVAGAFRRSRRLRRSLDLAVAGLFSAFALRLVLSRG